MLSREPFFSKRRDGLDCFRGMAAAVSIELTVVLVVVLLMLLAGVKL